MQAGKEAGKGAGTGHADRSRYLYYTKTQLSQMLERDKGDLTTIVALLREKKQRLSAVTTALNSKVRTEAAA